jgi:hypothetical protein
MGFRLLIGGWREGQKNPRAVSRARLCGGGKSVKVSRDRTVVLTIFWRVCCKGFALPAHSRIGADQATAMLRLTVDKDRKKYAA